MAVVPDKYLDILQKKAFANLATVMPDGTPQVTPVWFDYAGGAIRVNSARGRVKDRNMKEGAQVALSILDPDNAYRYLQVHQAEIGVGSLDGQIAVLQHQIPRYDTVARQNAAMVSSSAFTPVSAHTSSGVCSATAPSRNTVRITAPSSA